MSTFDRRRTAAKMALAITDLPFSMRLKDLLTGAGICTVADLVALKTERELLRIPNFGDAAFCEVKQVLGRNKLRLGMMPPGELPVTPLAQAETAAQALLGNGHPIGHNGGPPLDDGPETAAATLLDLEIDQLLSPAELARKLGTTERTLARWHAAGNGPPRCALPGRRIAYRPATVAVWLRNREARSERAAPRGPGRPPGR
jgi:hypothetical protein